MDSSKTKDKLDHHQMFEALCYKTAICVRDILIRIENSYIDKSTILMDEKAVYEQSKINYHNVIFPNKTPRHAFLCLDDGFCISIDDADKSNSLWTDIKNTIKSHTLLTRLYGLLLDNSILMQYGSRRGVWVEISEICINHIPSAIYSTNGLFIGGGNMSSRHNGRFEITSREIVYDWLNPFQNILKCLEQLLNIIDTCGINSENIDNDIVLTIAALFSNNTAHTICWRKLAEKLFGGLCKLSRYYNDNDYKALDWLHDIQYINETVVQNMIDTYLQRLVNPKPT